MTPPGPPAFPPPPSEPAPLKAGEVWGNLLLPQASLVVPCVIDFLGSAGQEPAAADGLGLIVGLILFLVSGIVCWIRFGIIIHRRYRGIGPVLMILAYPVAQLVVGVTFLFGMCLLVLGNPGL